MNERITARIAELRSAHSLFNAEAFVPALLKALEHEMETSRMLVSADMTSSQQCDYYERRKAKLADLLDGKEGK